MVPSQASHAMPWGALLGLIFFFIGSTHAQGVLTCPDILTITATQLKCEVTGAGSNPTVITKILNGTAAYEARSAGDVFYMTFGLPGTEQLLVFTSEIDGVPLEGSPMEVYIYDPNRQLPADATSLSCEGYSCTPDEGLLYIQQPILCTLTTLDGSTPRFMDYRWNVSHGMLTDISEGGNAINFTYIYTPSYIPTTAPVISGLRRHFNTESVTWSDTITNPADDAHHANPSSESSALPPPVPGSSTGDTTDQLIVESRSGRLYIGSYWAAMRFEHVDVPRGANVTSATLTFTSSEERLVDDSYVDIYVMDALNPPTPAWTPGAIMELPRANVSVRWNLTQWGKRLTYTSSDISILVDTAVHRQGWQAGNAIILIMNGLGRHTALSADSVEEGGPVLTPIITVQYNPDTASSTVATCLPIPKPYPNLTHNSRLECKEPYRGDKRVIIGTIRCDIHLLDSEERDVVSDVDELANTLNITVTDTFSNTYPLIRTTDTNNTIMTPDPRGVLCGFYGHCYIMFNVSVVDPPSGAIIYINVSYSDQHIADSPKRFLNGYLVQSTVDTSNKTQIVITSSATRVSHGVGGWIVMLLMAWALGWEW